MRRNSCCVVVHVLPQASWFLLPVLKSAQESSDLDVFSGLPSNGIIICFNLEIVQDNDYSFPILCFHSRGQHLCRLIGTKESVYIRKESISHRTGWGHKHGRRFIVLGHKYGRHDVM